ncbi:MAG: NAD(P)H-binding protein [Chloroflexota bacterium]|jgi:uncharacterized protein YbjT (DUF2867 family)
MKRILLTGGSGRLGHELVPRLQAAGYTVRVMSRRVAPTDRLAGLEWVQADLASGAGLAEALEGAGGVIHAASDVLKRRVDVDGTRRLLEEAQRVGVEQFVYISIVGVDQIDFGYYKNKLAAEQLIQASGLPWTILRATQFHGFADQILRALTWLPLAFLPKKWQFQSIAGADVAEQLLAAVQQGPAGRLPDIGGPEILSVDEMARQWLAAQGKRRATVHLPVPGGLSAGFRRGLNTVPDNRVGQISWSQWLQDRYGDESGVDASSVT